MNLQNQPSLLFFGVIICMFGVLLNVAMLRKRGVSAGLLAGAFLSFGLAMFLFGKGASAYICVPFAVIVVVLLAIDVVMRLKALGTPK